MKRESYNYLIEWKKSNGRMPLIIRGARQIGKTTTVRQFGETFDNIVELNFEQQPTLYPFFEGDLEPHKILTDLRLILPNLNITPGKTLLFLDEVQACPRVLIALRYFYELMPELHVIAAGSLLDFATEQVGMPVGRVQFLRMYPMSFKEFLWALGENVLADSILTRDPSNPFISVVHEKALRLFGEYIAIGGMPKAVQIWRDEKNYHRCQEVHHDLIRAYKQDFEKYARKSQIHYVEHLFQEIPSQLGGKFQFSKIPGDYRKRELAPALKLLEKANVVTRVQQTTANGFPLGACANPEYFKIIMMDIALTQTVLGLTSEQWILETENAFINKGAIAEAFVGQELLAYHNARRDATLYYWQRNQRGSEAEIDYVIARNEKIIPIEVKAGKGSTLKSMHLFLNENPHAPFGIRFSTQNYSVHEKIMSYPLYAVMRAVQD